MIHPAMQAVFDEHATPTHLSKRALHDQLAPILVVVTAAQHQLVALKALVAQAELADHDHATDGTMEHIRQTFAAAEREVNATMEHARGAAHAFVQLERYMSEQKKAFEPPIVPSSSAVASGSLHG